MFVCVYNSRFACACCFPGIFRGRTGWKVRARIKLAIGIYIRNAAGTAAACRLRPDPCIIGLFLTGSSIRRTIYFVLISTSLLYSISIIDDVLSCLGWWWRIIPIEWPPGFFFLGFFPSNTQWMLGHRQIHDVIREKVSCGDWYLLSILFWGIFAGGPRVFRL
jgi:hypothetical protein